MKLNSLKKKFFFSLTLFQKNMKVKINPPHITRAPPWCKLDPARNNTRTHRAVKSDSGRHNEIHIGTAVHDNGTHTHKPSAYNLYRVGMEKKKKQ